MIDVAAILEQEINSVSEPIKIQVDLSFDIANKIYALMEERGISKSQLADSLNVSEYDVACWISGTHNFSLVTIAKLSAFFGETIINVNK